MSSVEQRCAASRQGLFRRSALIAWIILASWELRAVTPVAETIAQVPGVWGGPGVALPTAPAPPVAPYYYPGPYNPRAFYPPPYYPPNYFYPCPRVWVPGYYDAYGNWVFGYYRYQC